MSKSKQAKPEEKKEEVEIQIKFPITEVVPLADIEYDSEDRFRFEMGDLEDLADSIRSEGLLSPVVVNQDLRLVAGGRRLEALKLLRCTVVPVNIVEARDELAQRIIELTENVKRCPMTWYEEATLQRRIYGLRSQADPEWSIRKQADSQGTSYGSVQRSIELATVCETIPQISDAPTAEAAWKGYSKIKETAAIQRARESADSATKQAFKWAEGHFKVMDAFEGLEALNNAAFDFVEVDPPYAVEITKIKQKSQHVQGLDKYEEIDKADYPAFVERLADECFRILRNDTFGVWWYGSEWYHVVSTALKKAGFRIDPVPAIWHKTGTQGQTQSPDTRLGSCYENFFCIRKGTNCKMALPGTSNVFTHPAVPPARKVHPTEKPLSLLKDILQTFCFPGSRIVVPFLGSGVTLRAAYSCEMLAFGYDTNPLNKQHFLAQVTRDIDEGLYSSK